MGRPEGIAPMRQQLSGRTVALVILPLVTVNTATSSMTKRLSVGLWVMS